MSKKVGIITQHRVVNYGSVLQTYALQEKIKDMGYECEVIDYYPNLFTHISIILSTITLFPQIYISFFH